MPGMAPLARGKYRNPYKASGPDDIPSWLPREYAVFLLLLFMKILNCSFKEKDLPNIWKLANTKLNSLFQN
jgi:hypothetical protein